MSSAVWESPSRPFTPSRAVRSGANDAAVTVDTRMLIVEHDRAIGRSLTGMLRANGFEDVRCVRSAQRALAVSNEFRPSIVFLDIALPEVDAYALARDLQRQTRQATTRLIALTGSVEHPTREQARSAGFERFLVKPVVQLELDKILRR